MSVFILPGNAKAEARVSNLSMGFLGELQNVFLLIVRQVQQHRI